MDIGFGNGLRTRGCTRRRNRWWSGRWYGGYSQYCSGFQSGYNRPGVDRLGHAPFNLLLDITPLVGGRFDMFKRLHIEEDLAAVGTIRPVLTTHDVGRYTTHMVHLGMSGGTEEDFGMYLERRLGNRTHIVVEEAGPVDGDHPLVTGHTVT